MPGPKVSVIIPNYNHVDFLRQRIESVLSQTFRDFEVILLDDASTDNSAELLRSYKSHPQVTHVVINEKNSGSPFLQWKKGLDLAQGEWVWIAESDDYADTSFLEKLIAYADNESTGLVYCDSAILNNDGTVEGTFAEIKNKKFFTERWSKNHACKGADEIEHYLLPGGTINNTSAVLFRRSVLKESDPFDLPLRYIGDKYAFVKVLSRSDVGYVAEALNFYRDPFNTRHGERYDKYMYEQFLVFAWVHRNMAVKNKEEFLNGFYANTRNSLFRNWDGEKVRMYFRLLKVNRYLFTLSFLNNLKLGLISAFGSAKG